MPQAAPAGPELSQNATNLLMIGGIFMLLLAAITLLAVLLQLVIPTRHVVTYGGDPLFTLHFAIAMLAYGLFIVATIHALLMLAEPTAAERAVLGAIPYSVNEAQLHTDESVLPRRRRARASWNYLMTPDRDNVLVTYDVSRLMRLAGPRRFLVTLGGRDRVDPGSVLAEMTYSHPVYTTDSVAAQQLLPTLDDDRVVFAGAYHGWGFHEDGAASGLRAAQRLGADWAGVARRAEAVPC